MTDHPTFRLSFDCPDCGKQWGEDARVRRDAACPRCGIVSLPTRVRQIEDWPHPTPRAPQRPYAQPEGLTMVKAADGSTEWVDAEELDAASEWLVRNGL